MHLSARAVIKESETALVTQRLMKQEWFNLIGGLLGSVFGLMGSFATGLGFFEGFVNRYEKNVYEKKNMKNFIGRINLLKSEFGQFKMNPKSPKVYPFSTTVESAYQ